GRSSRSTDAVWPDNRGGAEVLTRHLLESGHRAIAEVMGPPSFSTTKERSAGHRAVLSGAGVTHDPSLVATGHFTRDGGYEATKELLAGRARFTAIFAANDLMAMGALAALRESGLRVPDDVSLIGFDDVPTVRDVVPGLTTVSVPMREMGRRSIRIGLAGADRGPRLEMLPVHLVKRDSVSSPARRYAAHQHRSSLVQAPGLPFPICEQHPVAQSQVGAGDQPQRGVEDGAVCDQGILLRSDEPPVGNTWIVGMLEKPERHPGGDVSEPAGTVAHGRLHGRPSGWTASKMTRAMRSSAGPLQARPAYPASGRPSVVGDPIRRSPSPQFSMSLSRSSHHAPWVGS